MKSILKQKDAYEVYHINTAPWDPAQDGLRVQAFCRSSLFASWKSGGETRPNWLLSFVLKGGGRMRLGYGVTETIPLHRVAFLDLNRPSVPHELLSGTYERYFVLLEVTPLLRDCAARLFPELPVAFTAAAPARLKQAFESVRDAIDSNPHDDAAIAGAMFHLLAETARQYPHEPCPAALTMALHYMENHFIDPALDRSRIAGAAGVCISTLGRLFREHLHATIQEHLQKLRLEKAKRLLTFSDEPVSVVAESCGYRSPCYFAREFQRFSGSTPLRYRKKTRPR